MNQAMSGRIDLQIDKDLGLGVVMNDDPHTMWQYYELSYDSA